MDARQQRVLASLLACVIFAMVARGAWADFVVRDIDARFVNDALDITTTLDMSLSTRAEEALNKGIPLDVVIDLALVEHRRFLWDRVVTDRTLHRRIQYHALLNMYRVRNENSGEIRNFSTLTAAIDLLSSVRYIKLFKSLKIDPEQRYLAAVKVHFDRESLPLPLRPIAYLNPQWYLSSDSYIWLLTN